MISTPWQRATLILVATLISVEGTPVLYRALAKGLSAGDWALASPRALLYSALALVPMLVALAFLEHPRDWLDRLGLRAKLGRALLLALLLTLPMTVGYSFFGSFRFDADALVVVALLPGLQEEIFYRGFLFGLLYRTCRWPLLPAALVGSVVFGLQHAYQGNDLSSALLAVVFSGIGALWFSWIYARTDFNLWLPIGLHVLMNASVELYAIEGGVALGPATNVLRMVTIALTIVVVAGLRRRREESAGAKVRESEAGERAALD
ncbi:MAG: CPBP family intramembrane glutamic endopeptidase [Acidobacteriota bacterium]